MSEMQSPTGMQRPRHEAVIHDLGYRPYDGPRESEAAVCSSLFATGFKHAWGLGRGAKAKFLPFAMAALVLLPSLIMVTVYVLTGINQRIIEYSAYTGFVWLPVVVFVGAQAPVLFSRDLRSRAITLYLARPLRPVSYALMRYLSLLAAVAALVVAPLLLLWLGALLAELPVGQETQQMVKAVAGALLFAVLLAGIGSLLASWIPRRGLAVVAIIGVLIVVSGFVSAVVGIAALDEGNLQIAQIAGVFDPALLAGGIETKFLDGKSGGMAPPDSTAMGLFYVAMWCVFVIGGLALLFVRYRKAARG